MGPSSTGAAGSSEAVSNFSLSVSSGAFGSSAAFPSFSLLASISASTSTAATAQQPHLQCPMHGMVQNMHEDSISHHLQLIMTVVAAIIVGMTLLVFAGMTFSGAVIALVSATPLLVLFSPILVPVGIFFIFNILVFLSTGGIGLTALSVFFWLYHYITGNRPPGFVHVDSARHCIASKARDVEEGAKEFWRYVHNKAQGVMQAA